MKRAFTLVELLVCIAIIGVLAALVMPALRAAKIANSKVLSVHSLSTLSTAGRCYLTDHDNVFFSWMDNSSPEGTMWWYGWESADSLNSREGERSVDYTQGPLSHYATLNCDNVPTDPALLAFSPRLKPKYKDGNYGFGYNVDLSNVNAMQIATPSSQLVVFATSAQVNTFQAPANSKNPMIEEFYFISWNPAKWGKTVHFRHGGKALAGFLDGSVRELEMLPGTADNRMPAANIGLLDPKYLRPVTQ